MREPDVDRDPFDVLELRPGASVDEIRSSYRRLARVYHPDRQQHATPEVRAGAEAMMKELNIAYDMLITGRYAVDWRRRVTTRPGADAWQQARDAWSGFAKVVQDEISMAAQRYSATVPPPPSIVKTMREAWDFLRGRESSMPPLSIEEVAARLRISPRTVFRMLEKGALKGFRGAGGVWRVPVDALSGYLMGWEARSRARARSSSSEG